MVIIHPCELRARLRLIFLLAPARQPGVQRAARRHAHPHRAAGHPAGHGRASRPCPLTAPRPATAYVPLPTSLPAPPSHRIAIRQFYGLSEFYDRQTGREVHPTRGQLFQRTCCWHRTALTLRRHERLGRLEAAFQRLHAAGYNTLRLYLDSCASGPGCILLETGQAFNPAYLDNLVRLMNLAQANGLFLLLASVDLPAQSRLCRAGRRRAAPSSLPPTATATTSPRRACRPTAPTGATCWRAGAARRPLRDRAGLGAGG